MKAEKKMHQWMNYAMVLILFFSTSENAFSQMHKSSKQMIKQQFAPLDTAIIEQVVGIKGKANNGEYKITVPQN